MNNSFIKFIVLAVVVLGSIFAFVGCERIDAGHVGVKVNLYGDGKGVDDVTEVTGWVFYNPISISVKILFTLYISNALLLLCLAPSILFLSE